MEKGGGVAISRGNRAIRGENCERSIQLIRGKKRERSWGPSRNERGKDAFHKIRGRKNGKLAVPPI